LTQIVAVVKIFKTRELTAALQQAKPLRVFHCVAANGKVFRVIQRTPDPLAVTGKIESPLESCSAGR
jgi:hypothetical protein